jgi:tetratricopeptide (TPR) repeat protein
VTVDSGALQRAAALLELKRPQEAGELASRAAAAAPSDPEAWIVLARCYELTNEPRRALDMANRAIGLDPNDPDSHLIASRVLVAIGSYSLAVQAGQEAVRLAPMSAHAHSSLAIALSQLGNASSVFGHLLPRHLRLAAEHAQRAMALAPNSTVGYFAAGYVATKSNRVGEARKYYTRVLSIDPHNAAALNNIAKLDLGRGRFARSGEGFARALATDPSLGVARRNVRATVHMMTLMFHVLAWFIYVLFSGVAATPETGRISFAWSTRSEVALVMSLSYGALVAIAYLRMAPNVRAFATHRISESWIIKAVLVSDAFTLLCFVISNFGHGASTGTWYLLGFLGIGASYAGIVLSRTRS